MRPGRLILRGINNMTLFIWELHMFLWIASVFHTFEEEEIEELRCFLNFVESTVQRPMHRYSAGFRKLFSCFQLAMLRARKAYFDTRSPVVPRGRSTLYERIIIMHLTLESIPLYVPSPLLTTVPSIIPLLPPNYLYLRKAIEGRTGLRRGDVAMIVTMNDKHGRPVKYRIVLE